MATATATDNRITWTSNNTIVTEWFERDRAFVGLDTVNGQPIVEFWDEDVEQFAEDFKGLRQSFQDALIEYANDLQLSPSAI